MKCCNVEGTLNPAATATIPVAASAEEAFPNAEEEPDVVVIDFRLPGVNGAAFIKRFRETHTRARALVISADTDAMTIDAATDAGATFMAKPLDFELLGRWVDGGAA